MSEFVINDANAHKFISPIVGGEMRAKGLIQRDYGVMPFGSLPFAAPYDMQLIPTEEWDDRIADQENNRISLEHIRKDAGIRSLDQDGYGYCWSFSTTKAAMLVRAVANQPTVELSAWAVAAIIKNYRDQGGWCQQSLEFGVNIGFPSLKLWPQGQVKRSLDTAEMREDAGTRKILEWMDMEDRNWKQLGSNLLRLIPTMMDLNWWGHSVCGIRLMPRKSSGPWQASHMRVKIDNSWTPDWGEDGMAILEGNKAIPDGMAAPRVAMAA